VSGREKWGELITGIGGDERIAVVELDGVVRVERSPVEAEGVLLGCKRDGFAAATADAQIVRRILASVLRPEIWSRRDRGRPVDDPGMSGRRKRCAESFAVEISVADAVVGSCAGRHLIERLGMHTERVVYHARVEHIER